MAGSVCYLLETVFDRVVVHSVNW
uniref:Uncharacterized protein n=1 Tax=Rhizophora mucronata TaxID=61149 RepID=A0A2P2PBS8_RHIMU